MVALGEGWRGALFSHTQLDLAVSRGSLFLTSLLPHTDSSVAGDTPHRLLGAGTTYKVGSWRGCAVRAGTQKAAGMRGLQFSF